MKAHIVSSPNPLEDLSMVVTLCLQELEAGKQVFVWDEQSIGAEPMLSAVCFCRKCIEKAHEEHLVKTERRYLYGVVKGHIE
jgi:hypothetical protein